MVLLERELLSLSLCLALPYQILAFFLHFFSYFYFSSQSECWWSSIYCNSLASTEMWNTKKKKQLASDLTSFWYVLWICLWAHGYHIQTHNAKWLKPIVSILLSHIHLTTDACCIQCTLKSLLKKLSQLLFHPAMRGLSRTEHREILMTSCDLPAHSMRISASDWLAAQLQLDSVGTDSQHGCVADRADEVYMMWVRGFRAIWFLCLEVNTPGITEPSISLVFTLILLGLGTVPARRLLPHLSKPR